MGQISQAVQCLHQLKILHRDVKTHNIFLTANNQIKLGDLGEARQLNRASEQAQTHAGTESFMSPEILNGEKYSYKTDIWSLGCVLYLLCTLRPPFEAPGLYQLINKVIHE